MKCINNLFKGVGIMTFSEAFSVIRESRFGRVPWIPNYVELFAKEWEIV